MPQNTSIAVGASWQLLTDENVTTRLTFQNVGSSHVILQGTNGTTPPNANAPGIGYAPDEGEANRLLSEMFPGVAGVNRLWARSAGLPTTVFISHA